MWQQEPEINPYAVILSAARFASFRDLEDKARPYQIDIRTVIVQTALDSLTLTSNDQVLLAEKDREIIRIQFPYDDANASNQLKLEEACNEEPGYYTEIVKITPEQQLLLESAFLIYPFIKRFARGEDIPSTDETFDYGMKVLEFLRKLRIELGYRVRRTIIPGRKNIPIDVKLGAETFLTKIEREKKNTALVERSIKKIEALLELKKGSKPPPKNRINSYL